LPRSDVQKIVARVDRSIEFGYLKPGAYMFDEMGNRGTYPDGLTQLLPDLKSGATTIKRFPVIITGQGEEVYQVTAAPMPHATERFYVERNGVEIFGKNEV
jgi:hypothetical protein